MKSFFQHTWLWTLVLGVLLVIAAYRYAMPVDKVLDIGFADETRYLSRGMHLGEQNLHTLRAPIYAVWYAILSLVEHDPLALYDLNLRLQIILLPLALFVALRFADVPPFWAFLVSWGWLITDANLEPWPRVSAFAWIIILVGIGLYQRFRLSAKGWGFLLTAVGLSMYVRPEMMLPFVLLTAIGIWKTKQSDRLILVVWVSVLLLFLGAVFGSPNEPHRLFEAFGQHFAFRWRAQYVANGLPWNYWQEILNQAFDTQVNSFEDVLKANPQLVGKHVWANLCDVPKRWAKLLFSHTPYVLKRNSLWEGLLWMLIAVLAGGIGLWRRKNNSRFWRSHALTFLLVGILALPSLGSAVFIYPRTHYLLGPTILLWYLWAVVVFENPNGSPGIVQGKIVRLTIEGSIALLLVVTTPSVTTHFGFSPILDVRQTLVTLRYLHQRSGVNVVAVPRDEWGDKNAEVYLPSMDLLLIDPSPKFVAERLPKTRVIVLDKGNMWLTSSEGKAALSNLEREGWLALCTSRKHYIVLVREVHIDTDLVPVQQCRP